MSSEDEEEIYSIEKYFEKIIYEDEFIYITVNRDDIIFDTFDRFENMDIKRKRVNILTKMKMGMMKVVYSEIGFRRLVKK